MLALAGCGAKPKPYQLPAGSPVALYVVVIEHLDGARATSRRLEVATRGAVSEDGAFALEIGRARLEIRDAGGKVVVADTDVVAGGPSATDAEARAATRLFESIRTAPVRIALDPHVGVTAVEGLDRALDAAVAKDAELDETRAGLRNLLSDASWLRDLAAAGLCDVPASVREGGTAERKVRVRVAGRGVTTMLLAGPTAQDTSGLTAVQIEGKLASDASFDGEPGPPPPDTVGAVLVGEVTGRATTSYPVESGPPVMGEWTLATPFAGGLSVVTTTNFKLVRK